VSHPTLPIAKLVKPACLKGQENGKLRRGILRKCGIGGFLLAEPAARSCRALVAAANAAGFDVQATGTYRTYDRQEALFRSRYTTDILKGQPTRRWNGETWYQKPRTAAAAVPGTSNHGWGLAVDFAEERDGKPGVDSVGPKFVKWLIRNADRFGFSAELQSEPWHWRYIAGDKIPQAVLDFEGRA
jgi:LAS superfamily LD-carboxypeptidase LdcB